MSRLSLILLGLTLLLSSAIADDKKLRRRLGVGLRPPPPELAPLLSIAEIGATDPDLSLLVALVTQVGLGSALTVPGPITLFAPTNAAVAELIPDLENLDQLDPGPLTAVLTHHVVQGTYLASDITDGLMLPTFARDTIEFNVTGGVLTVDDYVITDTIVASNGVVHKIEGVMLPDSFFVPPTVEDPPVAPVAAPTDVPEPAPTDAPLPTIVELTFKDVDLSILAGLVKMAGLVDTLSSPGPFTVFAPINPAFLTVLSELGLDPTASYEGDVVAGLLTYHVVAGTYMASDIVDGLTLETVNSEMIEFGVDADGGVTVNGETVIVADIAASNGVIHKIDGILLPPTEAMAMASGTNTTEP